MGMNCAQAKDIDIVSFLQRIGHEPIRQTGNVFWFNLRGEKTASLKVDSHVNCWIDFGTDTGGKLIDLVAIYFTAGNIKQALRFIDTQGKSASYQPRQITVQNDNQITILKINPVIENKALIQYLNARKIALKIATKYLCEIYYQINHKKYFGLGFKNDTGGYEIRNKYFKGCIGKKAVTTIHTDENTVNIFEGIFDYLTYLQLKDQSGAGASMSDQAAIILNSILNLKNCISGLSKYQIINTYLDNDKAGIEATEQIKAIYPQTQDMSTIYRGYKDYNEYLMYKK